MWDIKFLRDFVRLLKQMRCKKKQHRRVRLRKKKEKKRKNEPSNRIYY